jgi:hypothetical protein
MSQSFAFQLFLQSAICVGLKREMTGFQAAVDQTRQPEEKPM